MSVVDYVCSNESVLAFIGMTWTALSTETVLRLSTNETISFTGGAKRRVGLPHGQSQLRRLESRLAAGSQRKFGHFDYRLERREAQQASHHQE